MDSISFSINSDSVLRSPEEDRSTSATTVESRVHEVGLRTISESSLSVASLDSDGIESEDPRKSLFAAVKAGDEYNIKQHLLSPSILPEDIEWAYIECSHNTEISEETLTFITRLRPLEMEETAVLHFVPHVYPDPIDSGRIDRPYRYSLLFTSPSNHSSEATSSGVASRITEATGLSFSGSRESVFRGLKPEKSSRFSEEESSESLPESLIDAIESGDDKTIILYFEGNPDVSKEDMEWVYVECSSNPSISPSTVAYISRLMNYEDEETPALHFHLPEFY